MKIKQNIEHKKSKIIEEYNSIWWKVNFFSKFLKIRAPITNPTDRQRNNDEYSVSGYPVFSERYGTRGPIPEIMLPYAKKLKE